MNSLMSFLNFLTSSIIGLLKLSNKTLVKYNVNIATFIIILTTPATISDISIIEPINNIKENDILEIIDDNPFLSKNFIITIKKFIKFQTSIMYNNNYIYIFYDKNDKIKINKIINKIKIIINYLNNFTKIEGMLLYLILSDVKKNLINDTYLLNGDNINSGICSPTFIYIWREEELFKVLIHEMMHYFKLDKYSISHKDYRNEINIILGDNKYNLIINEAYTELLAILINIMIFVILNNTNNKNKKKLFFKIFTKEVIHSYNNVIKILNYYDINNFKELYTKNNFNQRSNVFSYIILKFLLIFKIDELNIFYKDKDKKIKINNENINNFEQIVKEILNINKNYKYINLINLKLNKENNFDKNNLKLSISNLYDEDYISFL